MAKDKILIICPSRNRPENIQALWQTWDETAIGYSDLLVALDDDNEEQYPRIDRVLYEVNPRIRMVPTLNLVATKYADDYRYIGFVGDDHRFRTPGWDLRVRNEIHNMKNAIVYGDDKLQGEVLATAVFLDANIVRTLGYMAPPGLVHMYADNFWMDLGRQLGTLVYCGDVIVEHMHPAAGKVESDAQYTEVDAFTPQDRETYGIYKETVFSEDVEKLLP